jgi:hypothetical protein
MMHESEVHTILDDGTQMAFIIAGMKEETGIQMP